MPQQQNSVGPSVLIALSRQIVAITTTLQGDALHRQYRQGAAWFTEWLTQRQICISTRAALSQALSLNTKISPDPAAMARGLHDGLGLIQAKTISFALDYLLPRPQAQARVTAVCAKATDTATPLATLAVCDFPGIDWSAHLSAQSGQVPAEALAFAQRILTGWQACDTALGPTRASSARDKQDGSSMPMS